MSMHNPAHPGELLAGWPDGLGLCETLELQCADLRQGSSLRVLLFASFENVLPGVFRQGQKIQCR